MSTRIFISHSSKDNALTGAVCDALRVGGSYEVLVDTTHLEAAEPWPLQLHEMMADCHAALVLLSSNAVRSDWVLKETTILTWRCSLEQDFKLFIAQFPEVTAADLRQAKYDPLQHRLIQGIDSTDAAQIAARVRARLDAEQVRPQRTLFDRLVISLSDVLTQVSDDALTAVADRLGTERPPWRPGAKSRDLLVDRIACHILRGQLGTYAGVSQLIEDLRATRLLREHLNLVLRLAAPYWVDPAAAGQLGAVPAGADTPLPATAIDGREVKRYTAKMYVQRAYPLTFGLSVLSPTPASAGNVFDHYTQQICAFCRKEDEKRDEPLYPDMSDAEIVAQLKHDKAWLFVVIAPIDAKALDELQTAFPRVRFILDAGGLNGDAVLPAQAMLLLPRVDQATEVNACTDYREAIRATTR